MVNSTKVETIEKLIRGERDLEVKAMCHGYKRNGEVDSVLLSEAVKAAQDGFSPKLSRRRRTQMWSSTSSGLTR